MPRKKRSTNVVDLKAVLGQEGDMLRPLVTLPLESSPYCE